MPTEIFDRAEVQLKNDLPFVLYRKPKRTVLNGFFQNTSTLAHTSDFKEKGFVFAPFDSVAKVVLLRPDELLEMDIKELQGESFFQNNEIVTNPPEKSFHIDLVKKGVHNIKKGRFQKIVLSRKINAVTKTDPIQLFRKLLKMYENAFCYLWFHPKVGMWLGATPEILLKTKGRGFTTMSLAGTQIKDNDSGPNWQDKELKEQRLVTDYIINALTDKVNKLEIGGLESVSAGHLWHLRTKISGNYKIERLNDLIHALHPTPAVCGMPKKETREFILNTENYNRLFYTGYLGELNFPMDQLRNRNSHNIENNAYKTVLKCTELYVNLRCMSLLKGKASIYVGGGITADSDPEKEWEETVHKSNTMLKVLS
ncbi:chorismate-binding protein [Maribacter sp. 2304DJ31-5]|uniref:chorismate-binding protein n=1 Tax=Maribacter sp. 2304DJ31-5 TaxID=3386273 RepID=UPI0039BD240D